MPRLRAYALICLIALAGVTITSPAARAADKVDLLLVLAADISRSIDEPKFRLQRDGYAAAIVDSRVIKAIESGPNGRIAICFVEWSGPGAQAVIVNWTEIGNAVQARDFAARIREAPRRFMDRTAIGAAIDFSVRQFEEAPFEASRRVIDVSGDGTNNAGRDVVEARQAALDKGFTINGLVILTDTPLIYNPTHTHPPGGLQTYYENNVVGGPGAFVFAAENFESFGTSITSKLIKEIATLNDDGTGGQAVRVLR